MDAQYVRNYLKSINFDKKTRIELPEDVSRRSKSDTQQFGCHACRTRHPSMWPRGSPSDTSHSHSRRLSQVIEATIDKYRTIYKLLTDAEPAL